MAVVIIDVYLVYFWKSFKRYAHIDVIDVT